MDTKPLVASEKVTASHANSESATRYTNLPSPAIQRWLNQRPTDEGHWERWNARDKWGGDKDNRPREEELIPTYEPTQPPTYSSSHWFDQSQNEGSSNLLKRPLPPIAVNPSNKIALKRARNTLAARDARQMVFEGKAMWPDEGLGLEVAEEAKEIVPPVLPYEKAEPIKCGMCNLVFHSAFEHQKHMLRHNKVFKCTEPNCRRADKGFSTANALERHRKSMHRKSMHRIGASRNSWKCSAESCRNKDKIWPRLDNFKEHLRRMHKDEDEASMIQKSVYFPEISQPVIYDPPISMAPTYPNTPPFIPYRETINVDPYPDPDGPLGYNYLMGRPPFDHVNWNTKDNKDVDRTSLFGNEQMGHEQVTASEGLHKDLNLAEPDFSDSGYRSGLGTDTASVCSVNSTGSSLGLPQNFFQDFIAFFGETLIEKTNARQWAESAVAYHSSENIESRLNILLKEYAIDMVSGPSGPSSLRRLEGAPGRYDRAVDQTQQVLNGAVNLIRRYRPKFARYYRENMIHVSRNDNSLNTRLQKLGQQLSLSEKFGLFAKSSFHNQNIDESLDDGLTENPEEEELLAKLQSVQDVLVSSDAFHRLTLNIKHTLYHNDRGEMENIRTAVISASQNASKSFMAYLDVEWAIGEFISSQYGKDLPNIGSVVVLTGSALYAQATTCTQYVLQTWPKTGSFFLQVVDDIIKESGELKVSETLQRGKHFTSPELGLSLNATMRNPSTFTLGRSERLRKLSICAETDDIDLVVEFAQQFAWLGSAMNASSFGDHLAYSVPIFQLTTGGVFEITFKQSPLHASETPCWLPLFCGAVIVSGFPVPDRGNETGLEIPLDLIAGLAGVRHAVEFEGGVVMKGFSQMLVPVRKDSSRVQWHVVYNEDPDTRLTYQEALSRCGPRALLPEVSLEDLQSTRAIVGWYPFSKSRLGSPSANYGNLDYSKAKEPGKELACSGISAGFQQFAVASASFQIRTRDGKYTYPRHGRFPKIASAAEETPVVLCDTGEKRSCLVPASGVMLHMLQHRHHLEPFEVDMLNTEIPPGSTALKVLLSNQRLVLFKEDNHTFEDEIRNIWSLLELLVEKNVTRHREEPGMSVPGTFRTYLYGFEFNAVVRERSPFRLKETQLSENNGGWPLLISDIDALVLLADGFEDILLPAEETDQKLCRRWQRVPKGHDYLATTTKIMQQLYEEAGCRLDRRYLSSKHHLRWHQGNSTLFDPCDQQARCKCDRLQQLFPKSAIGTIVPPNRMCDEGLVIFGRADRSIVSKPRTEAPKISKIYSQPNVALSPLVIHNESDDSALSDNTASIWSKSDATEVSSSESQIFCSTFSGPICDSIKDEALDKTPNQRERMVTVTR